MSRHLQVFPELLEFPMRLKADTLVTASLRNASASYLAFKVKTTATERYRVRPNLGVVAPGETAHVKLVLVAQDEFGPQLADCRDRFLVQSLPIKPGQKPDGAAFRAQKFKVQDHKLRVSIVLVHNTAALTDTSGLGSNSSIAKGASNAKRLNSVASPLEKEIRSSLMCIAEEQGADGHRSCLTKFSELLLLNGVISTQQMGVALDLVEALFETEAEHPEVAELNRSVHTWLEESENSGSHSDALSGLPSDGRSSSHAEEGLAQPGSPPPVPRGSNGIQSGRPPNGILGSPNNRNVIQGSLRARASPSAPAQLEPDPHTANPQDLFPSPPDSPPSGARGVATGPGVERHRSVARPKRVPPRDQSRPYDGPEAEAAVRSFATLGPPPESQAAPRVPACFKNPSSSDTSDGRIMILEDPSEEDEDLPARIERMERNERWIAGEAVGEPAATAPGRGREANQPPIQRTPTKSSPEANVAEKPVPDSPARNLAAMLRSTLRTSGGGSANTSSLRDAALLSDPSSGQVAAPNAGWLDPKQQ